MKNEQLFAKIPNNIISIKNEEGFTEEGSLLKIIKDDKIIRVLYELYIGSDFRNICVTSIGRLITLCGYKSDKDTVKSFKSLLNALNDNEVIKIENEIGKINEAIIINVENSGLLLFIGSAKKTAITPITAILSISVSTLSYFYLLISA